MQSKWQNILLDKLSKEDGEEIDIQKDLKENSQLRLDYDKKSYPVT